VSGGRRVLRLLWRGLCAENLRRPNGGVLRSVTPFMQEGRRIREGVQGDTGRAVDLLACAVIRRLDERLDLVE
jgi:hypothetical protein